MIPLGDTKQYRFFEVLGKNSLTFKQSPFLDITDENRKTIESLEKGQIVTLKSNEAGVETDYKIVDISLYVSNAYPDGLLSISVSHTGSKIEIDENGTYKKTLRNRWNGDWTSVPGDIVEIQPMSQPSGLVFYLDFKYLKNP